MVESIKMLLENKQSDIEKIVKTSNYSMKTSAQRPTYSSVTANKKTINKNKIIIKADNIDQFDKELKQKICPNKEKVNVTFYKK